MGDWVTNSHVSLLGPVSPLLRLDGSYDVIRWGASTECGEKFGRVATGVSREEAYAIVFQEAERVGRLVGASA
jgi:hypothetical protein